MEFRLMTAAERALWYGSDFSEAFAPNERKPLPDIEKLIAAGRYELWGLFDGFDMAGYAALWKKEGLPLVLLDYLGVSAGRRNRGLGSEILHRLKDRVPLLVTEAELPRPGDSREENCLRRRRIAFYERNGFTPAYKMATCGLGWQALLSGAASHALSDIMHWHKELYGPEREDVLVPLPPGHVPPLPYWMKQ